MRGGAAGAEFVVPLSEEEIEVAEFVGGGDGEDAGELGEIGGVVAVERGAGQTGSVEDGVPVVLGPPEGEGAAELVQIDDGFTAAGLGAAVGIVEPAAVLGLA
jgi:hypothetical protein